MSGDGLCGRHTGTAVSSTISPVVPAAIASGVSGESSAAPVETVSNAVAEWVEQVGRFLGVLQLALEQSHPRDDATAEVRALSGQLPALIRQCRAQVPTPEMIRTWVKSVNGQSLEAAVGGAA
jgi:hypothetical protein